MKESYLLRVLKHKWFVLYYGMKYTKAPLWNLIIHDWSKFLPCEYFAYKNYHMTQNELKTDKIKDDFSIAWLHHQNSNKHHWEWYISRSGHSSSSQSINEYHILDMPEKYIREMIADWMAASRVYTGKIPKMGDWPWFDNNWPVIQKNTSEKTSSTIMLKLRMLRDKGIL